MTDLNRLNVSLTRQGAYRIFPLLRDNEPEEWVNEAQRLSRPAERGQRIDLPQFRKTLADQGNGQNILLPNFWEVARDAGENTLRDLFLIGMIFSHHVYLDVMRQSQTGRASGRVQANRDFGADGRKNFTNFRNNLRELGLVRDEPNGDVTYDFGSFFDDPALPPLVVELLEAKLRSANWLTDADDCPDLLDECIRQNFHEVFGLSEDEFHDWLNGVQIDGRVVDILEDPDPNVADIGQFEFASGHREGREGAGRRRTVRAGIVRFTHNRLQTLLYSQFARQYGEHRVGTEVRTGVGETLIDVVVEETENQYTFYEIKTAPSIRKCIREGLAQVMEYSHWPDAQRAQKLVIVAPCTVTEDATSYLRNLRQTYGLPVFYRSIDPATGVLSDEI